MHLNRLGDMEMLRADIIKVVNVPVADGAIKYCSYYLIM